jgi:hypothetical protein
MKKRVMALILSAVLMLSVSGCSESELHNNALPPLTEYAQTGTTTASLPETQAVTSPEVTDLPQELSISEEIPLAGGAMLLIKRDDDDWFNSGWLLYDENDEPDFLFSMYNGNFSVSPDKTKIAYFTDEYCHGGGTPNIYNVTKRRSVVAEFDGHNREDFHNVLRFAWLDDDILLVINKFMGGSASVGGSVFYYNYTDGANRMIIPYTVDDDRHFMLTNLEIDGDNLRLTAAIDRRGANFLGEFADCSIPLTQVRRLIGNGETLTLPVSHWV